MTPQEVVRFRHERGIEIVAQRSARTGSTRSTEGGILSCLILS